MCQSQRNETNKVGVYETKSKERKKRKNLVTGPGWQLKFQIQRTEIKGMFEN